MGIEFEIGVNCNKQLHAFNTLRKSVFFQQQRVILFYWAYYRLPLNAILIAISSVYNFWFQIF